MFNLFLRRGLTCPSLPAAYARTGKIKHFCGISYPIGKFLRKAQYATRRSGGKAECNGVPNPRLKRGFFFYVNPLSNLWFDIPSGERSRPNRKTIRHAPSGAVAKRLGLGRDAIRTQKEVPDWTPLFACGWRDSNSHRKNSHYPLKVARLPFRHIRFELGLQR